MEGRAFCLASEREKPLPPKYVRMSGRPNKERKREDDEKKKTPRVKMTKQGQLLGAEYAKGLDTIVVLVAGHV